MATLSDGNPPDLPQTLQETTTAVTSLKQAFASSVEKITNLKNVVESTIPAVTAASGSTIRFHLAAFNAVVSSLEKTPVTLEAELTKCTTKVNEAIDAYAAAKKKYEALSEAVQSEQQQHTQEYQSQMRILSDKQKQASDRQDKAVAAQSDAVVSRQNWEEEVKTLKSVSAHLKQVEIEHTAALRRAEQDRDEAKARLADALKRIEVIRQKAGGDEVQAVEAARIAGYNSGFYEARALGKQELESAEERHFNQILEVTKDSENRNGEVLEQLRYTDVAEEKVASLERQLLECQKNCRGLEVAKLKAVQDTKGEMRADCDRRIELMNKVHDDRMRTLQSILSAEVDKLQGFSHGITLAVRDQGQELVRNLVDYLGNEAANHFLRLEQEVADQIQLWVDKFQQMMDREALMDASDQEYRTTQTKLNQDLIDAAKNVQTAIEQAAQRATVIADQTARIQELEAEANRLNETIQTHRDAQEELRTANTQLQTAQNNLQATHNDMRTAYDQLQANATTMEGRNSQLRSDVDAAKIDAAQHQAKFTQLQQDKAMLDYQYAQCQARVNELISDQKKCDQELVAARGEAKMREGEAKSRELRISQLETVSKEHTQKIKDLYSEILRLTDERAAFKTRAELCEDERKKRDEQALRVAGHTTAETDPTFRHPFIQRQPSRPSDFRSSSGSGNDNTSRLRPVDQPEQQMQRSVHNPLFGPNLQFGSGGSARVFGEPSLVGGQPATSQVPHTDPRLLSSTITPDFPSSHPRDEDVSPAGQPARKKLQVSGPGTEGGSTAGRSRFDGSSGRPNPASQLSLPDDDTTARIERVSPNPNPQVGSLKHKYGRAETPPPLPSTQFAAAPSSIQDMEGETGNEPETPTHQSGSGVLHGIRRVTNIVMRRPTSRLSTADDTGTEQATASTTSERRSGSMLSILRIGASVPQVRTTSATGQAIQPPTDTGGTAQPSPPPTSTAADNWLANSLIGTSNNARRALYHRLFSAMRFSAYDAENHAVAMFLSMMGTHLNRWISGLVEDLDRATASVCLTSVLRKTPQAFDDLNDPGHIYSCKNCKGERVCWSVCRAHGLEYDKAFQKKVKKGRKTVQDEKEDTARAALKFKTDRFGKRWICTCRPNGPLEPPGPPGPGGHGDDGTGGGNQAGLAA